MIYYLRLTVLLLFVSTSLLHAMEHDAIDVVPATNTLLGIPAEVRLIIFDKTLQEECKAQPHILAFFKRLRELRTVHTTFRTQMLEEGKESQSQKFIEACGHKEMPYARCLKTILSARRDLTSFERLALSYFSSAVPEIGDSGALMHHALEEIDLEVARAVIPTLTFFDLAADVEFIILPFEKAVTKADTDTKERLRALRDCITHKFPPFHDMQYLLESEDFYEVFASLLQCFNVENAVAHILTIFPLEKKDRYLFEKVLSNTPCNWAEESQPILNMCLALAIQNRNIQLVTDLIHSGKITPKIIIACGFLCCKYGFLDLFKKLLWVPTLLSNAMEYVRYRYIVEAFNSEHENIIRYCLNYTTYEQEGNSLRLCRLCFENNAQELIDFLASVRSGRTRISPQILDPAFIYLINKGKKECINALLSCDCLSTNSASCLITHAKIQGQYEIAHMLMRKLATITDNKPAWASTPGI